MYRRTSIPRYRKHKQSGQAIVTLPDGLGRRHDKLLGPYATKESRAEYARVIAEWEANDRVMPRLAAADLTVNELLVSYWRHVKEYYRRPDGTPTNEIDNIRLALQPLRQLYGHTPAAAFDGIALETVREQMIRDGRCRKRINRDIPRLKRVFRWAATKKLLPIAVYQGLQAVEGLRAGRSAARETDSVKPVALSVVEATLPYLRPQPAAMVQLQLHTGMRPGEATIMRGIDLDTSGKVWVYRPGSDKGEAGAHKTAYLGHQKVILIGPRAQEVVRPWLRLNLNEYLFQPKESRAAFDAERRASRKSKVPPSQAKRQRKRKPKRAPADHYRVSSYDHAIAAAVDAANEQAAAKGRPSIPHWHPHQLRHLKATEIRREAGLDAARAVLGHRSPAITEVYAEADVGKAAEVMERLG